ncbi:MAG: transposase [Candidatus Hydrothermarchaeota archaeon]
MAKARYKKDTQESIFGHFLYDQVLPRKHFLVKARHTIEWGRFDKKLLKYYQGGAEYGKPPYAPSKMLRMLMLSYLYDISERESEEFTNLNLAAKYFVGLGVDEKAPDHSSLSVFKQRIIDRVGLKGYESMFNELLKEAIKKGVKFGQIQIVDSVHTVADVNIDKDRIRQKKGKAPRDKDARWGVKRVKEIKGKGGKRKKIKESFYGYKTHVSYNQEVRMATALKVSSGNKADNKEMTTLVNKDRKVGIAKGGKLKKDLRKKKIIVSGGTAYTGDKGYDDGENHEFLEARLMHSAIMLKDKRTSSKQEENNKAWKKFKQRDIYQKATGLRYQVEQPFGIAKKWHGFARCRYVGKTKMAIQAYMTFMAMNLKQIIKLKCGVPFRNGYGIAYAKAKSPG